MRRTSAIQKRLTVLIEMNAGWLLQARAVVSQINDDLYCALVRKHAPLNIGSHLRHILEFYECFLDGVDWAHVDYDARRRDESIERSRTAALAKIDALKTRLEKSPELLRDSLVFVKTEDAAGFGLEDPYVLSSVGRELMALSSHTVHHFALIAVALREHGIEPGEEFGVAPSTLRYRESLRREAA